MFKTLVQSAINRLGFELIRKNTKQSSKSRNTESESDEMIKIVRNNTMVAHAGLSSLYHQALFCETHKLVGDYVECGVWRGGAAGLMALVNLKHGSLRRHIHLFDSFEEICEPDEEIDGDRAISEVKMWTKNGGTTGRLLPLKGIYDHLGGPGTIQDNVDLLKHAVGYDPEYIHFHKGWLQQTLPEQHSEIKKIAILRIDVDWYASTKICLEYLFHKVISGGFVIIDDYGAYDGCRKAVDDFLKFIGKPVFLNYINSEIRYIVAP